VYYVCLLGFRESADVRVSVKIDIQFFLSGWLPLPASAYVEGVRAPFSLLAGFERGWSDFFVLMKRQLKLQNPLFQLSTSAPLQKENA